jgi:hypothetical protein
MNPEITTGADTEKHANDHSRARVSLILIPANYSATQAVRRLFPEAEEATEPSTRVVCGGTILEDEAQAFHCSYPSMDAARQALLTVPSHVTMRLEPVMTVNEEDCEVLAKFYAHRVWEEDWCDEMLWRGHCTNIGDPRSRLGDLARVLGEETVQKMVKEADPAAGFKECEEPADLRECPGANR